MADPAESRKPNAQQKAAVEAAAPRVILSSGAGCGKTSVLTARYVALLKTCEVRHIVAMTFTERAAREMRARVRTSVETMVKTSDNKSAWEQHLRDLDGAQILTIHGFCTRLLKRFPRQAGLDPEFEVLDPALAASLRAEAIRNRLSALLTEESERGLDLQELIVLYGWATVRRTMEALVADAAVNAWTAWLASADGVIARQWMTVERPRIAASFVAYLFATNPDLIRAEQVLAQIDPPVPEGRVTIRTVADSLRQLRDPDQFDRVDLEQFREAASIGHHLKGKRLYGEADYPAVRDAFKAIREDLCDELLKLAAGPIEPVVEAAGVARRALRVALELVGEIQRIKQQRAVVDFGDQLNLTRALLREHPGIARSLSREFHHLLVDEFQDTDPIQLEIVQTLCGEAPGERKLFCVGDLKQAIYRFRGAEVSLFEGLRQSIPSEGRLSLTLNYRSVPAILEFVNALFTRRMAHYEPLEGGVPKAAFQRPIEFLWSVTDNPDKEHADELRAREAATIARRIVDLRRDPVHPVRLSDIVLLFRSMTHVPIYEAALRAFGLDYYLVGGRAFFAQQEIYDLWNLLKSIENPYDGPALVGLLRSPFCGLSDDTITRLSQAGETIWDAVSDPDLSEAVPEPERELVRLARSRLMSWRAIKDRTPIARLIGLAFADTGYDAATQFEPLADRKLANLWKLVELARTFDASGYGLPEFIRQLDEQIARQPREEQAATRPESDNVIRLMSIHQAKGLEYPVVIVPDLAQRVQGARHEPIHWHRRLGGLPRLPADLGDDDQPPFSELPYQLGQAADRIDEWQDDLRIFYVACTRAKQLLILSAGWQGAGPCEPDERGGTRIPPSHVNHLTATLAERFDLKSGRCLDPSVPPSVTASIQVRYELPNSEAPSVIGDMKPVPEPQPAPPAGLLEPPSAEGIDRDPFDIHDSPATEWNCLK